MKKLLPILCLLILAASVNDVLGGQWTILDVSGEQVKIYRDEYGVPHIFAETNRGLFEGYGYAIAEDRLWQLELFRRASQGRLSEIFGASVLVTNVGTQPALTAMAADRDIRTRHYTNAELQEQLARLDAEEVEIFTAYADGINRYVSDVVAPDPEAKLPYEFHHLQIGLPEPWTTLDVVASAVYQSRFGQVGGQERRNRTLFNNLVAKHGQTGARAIFNDIRWVDDPDTPVTVPVSGAVGKRQKAPSDVPAPEQIEGASGAPESMEEDADAVFGAVGVPTTIGSHGWVVSPAKSANGSAMLFGGPQVQFNTPELFHEVQLKGGNGFNVMGRAFAGVPIVFSGRTDHMTWTMTTGTFGDVRDTYIEALCNGGRGYLFNGTCTPFELRVEVIKVKGAASDNFPVLRTIHGPVIQGSDASRPGICTAPCFSQKRVSWKREMESERAFLALNRARNLQEFEAAVRMLEISHNILYADKVGNIAYWLSGKIPFRPAEFDARLPFPGTGEAEWPGDYRPVPFSINPTRGWLTNWNSKPEAGYPNPDQRSFGKQYRSLEIDQLLETGLISLSDMKNIAEDIARTEAGGDGRDWRYLKPYLLRALDEFPPANPLAAQARSVLESWDGSLFADAKSSTTLEPGQVIFDRWLSLMLTRTFGDELGIEVSQATSNMLIHVLEQALGGGSAVPPTRDYLNGSAPNQVMSSVFDEALAALGGDPAKWSSQPRAIVRFRHTLYPAIPEVATMPDSNRGTYAMVIVLSKPQPTSESILSLGASGFIGRDALNAPRFDPHFSDQLSLFRNFQYKPMRLYRNTQLHE